MSKNKGITRITSILKNSLVFILVFGLTFVGMHYFKTYQKVAHCHVLSPLKEEFFMFPEYEKFFNKYQKRFNIAYRRVGGAPQVMFMDHRYRELKVVNVTDFKSEQIADLIRQHGFKEEEITQDHPEFVKERDYQDKRYESLSDAEKAAIEEKHKIVFRDDPDPSEMEMQPEKEEGDL